MPSSPYRPALASKDAAPSSPLVPEAYYSNEDIRVLHDVVGKAQENIAELPEGERLATNALFRAYDEVLPLYGIDPEQDQHISRLVFRVGGERGDGSLLDKFRAVLSRMGIEIEIDFNSDNLTTSSRAYSEVSPDFHPGFLPTGPSRPSYDKHQPTLGPSVSLDLISPPRGVETRGEESKLFDPKPDVRLDERDAKAGNAEFEVTGPGLPHYHPPDPHPQETMPAPPPWASCHAAQTHRNRSSAQEGHNSPENRIGTSPVHPDGRDQHVPQQEVAETPLSSEHEARYSRLERLALRAWDLYQLTKAISHWSACAEEKDERTAVARRHILRFRHFGPWAQATAEAKHRWRRMTISLIARKWIEVSAREALRQQDPPRLVALNTKAQIIRRWATITVTAFQPNKPTNAASSALARSTLQQWQHVCLRSGKFGSRAARFEELSLATRHTSFWIITVAQITRDSDLLADQITFGNTFHLWDLAVRSRRFYSALELEKARDLLHTWFRRSGPVNDLHEQHVGAPYAGVPVQSQIDDPTMLRVRFGRSVAAIVLRCWQQNAGYLETFGLYNQVIAAQGNAGRTLRLWAYEDYHGEELAAWAARARRYSHLTRALEDWRRSLPRWGSTTRKAYTRCRWKHKALLTRRQLSIWRGAVRSLDDTAQLAIGSQLEIDTRRVTQALISWRQEHEALAANERPMHLHSTWLDEWVVGLGGLHLLEKDAVEAWDRLLTTTVWSKWHSLSVQLHSRIYVVEDVTGKSARKLTRRVLAYWHQGGLGGLGGSLMSSHLGSTTGPSRKSQSHGLSLWPKARSGHTAATSLTAVDSRAWTQGSVDDPNLETLESDSDEDHDVVNTPTRWTGIHSPLAQLPSTTPFAPLSTPFERELRGRYNSSARVSYGARSDAPSVRATPRLSILDARRKAEERRQKSRYGQLSRSNPLKDSL